MSFPACARGRDLTCSQRLIVVSRTHAHLPASGPCNHVISGNILDRQVGRLIRPLVQQLQRVGALGPDSIYSVLAQGQTDRDLSLSDVGLDHLDNTGHSLGRVARLLVVGPLEACKLAVHERLVIVDLRVDIDRVRLVEKLGPEEPGLNKERLDPEGSRFYVQALDRAYDY